MGVLCAGWTPIFVWWMESDCCVCSKCVVCSMQKSFVVYRMDWGVLYTQDGLGVYVRSKCVHRMKSGFRMQHYWPVFLHHKDELDIGSRCLYRMEFSGFLSAGWWNGMCK